MQWDLTVAGLIVGTVVGLTGMGGGALMTPILILFFNVTPSSAVASDLVASLFMKPFGGAVHWRAQTVHKGIVRWLLVSSIPFAFVGALVLRLLKDSSAAQDGVKYALGSALLLAFSAMVVRQFYVRRYLPDDGLDTQVKVLPTVLLGAVGGLVVGMTSVGSGSMIIVAMMFLYPRLSNRALVGTDLVQAVPLVAAAALGQAIFGYVQLSIAGSLLVGGIPGVLVGAQISSRTTAPWLRPVLAGVLLASALKLLNAPSIPTGAAAVTVAIALLIISDVVRRRAARSAAETPSGGAPDAHLSEV
jgi:uncharacterized membrane protein YfcA